MKMVPFGLVMPQKLDNANAKGKSTFTTLKLKLVRSISKTRKKCFYN